MPRRRVDWWGSFSQSSDHPSSAFNCSKSYRMASRCWWAHCGHLTESRLFRKEQKLTRAWAWEHLAHHVMLLRKEQTWRVQEFQGSCVFVLLIVKVQLNSTCLPEHSLAWQCSFYGNNAPDISCAFESLLIHSSHKLLSAWNVAVMTEKLDFFFYFCFIFIILNLNGAWD